MYEHKHQSYSVSTELILHESLFSLTANSRISSGLRIAAITHLCFLCISHFMSRDQSGLQLSSSCGAACVW